MALSGLQIFQLLPRTNCKECGHPTCLAFAMKLASKGASIEECPDASDEAKAKLGAAAEPPMRTVRVGPAAAPLLLGGETVCYRHEKTFVHPTAIGVGVPDDLPAAELAARLEALAGYEVERVGERLAVDLVWLRAAGGDLVAAAQAVAAGWPGAVVVDAPDAGALRAAAEELRDRRPILLGAAPEVLVPLAGELGAVPVVGARGATELAAASERATAAGVSDLLRRVDAEGAGERVLQHTVVRRAALRQEVRALGHPLLMVARPGPQAMADGVVGICKYASVLLLPEPAPALLYALLTLRQSIFTDPQKPIQVEPGVYPIGSPGPDAPAFVTTNFSLTYFMVAGELENAGVSAHLVVHDCEGMSVLTAWAAGKFTGDKVAQFLRAAELPGLGPGKTLVIPGYAAVLQGDLEDLLPGVRVLVGPREAVDIAPYVKQVLRAA